MRSNVAIYIILLIGSCTILTNKAAAQTEIWSVDAAKYVGKIVTFEEYADTVIYNAATKTCLIKLADPDVAGSPTITVLIRQVNKGRRLHFLKHLEGNTITITGRMINGKNGFVINGNDPHTKIIDEVDIPNIDPMPPPPVPDQPPVNH